MHLLAPELKKRSRQHVDVDRLRLSLRAGRHPDGVRPTYARLLEEATRRGAAAVPAAAAPRGAVGACNALVHCSDRVGASHWYPALVRHLLVLSGEVSMDTYSALTLTLLVGILLASLALALGL